MDKALAKALFSFGINAQDIEKLVDAINATGIPQSAAAEKFLEEWKETAGPHIQDEGTLLSLGAWAWRDLTGAEPTWSRYAAGGI